MSRNDHSRYWIENAVARHPGKFRRLCQREGYGGATMACIAKEKHSRNATTRHEANLANTLTHLHHGSGITKRSGPRGFDDPDRF